jgi:hypothetical protein
LLAQDIVKIQSYKREKKNSRTIALECQKKQTKNLGNLQNKAKTTMKNLHKDKQTSYKKSTKHSMK